MRFCWTCITKIPKAQSKNANLRKMITNLMIQDYWSLRYCRLRCNFKKKLGSLGHLHFWLQSTVWGHSREYSMGVLLLQKSSVQFLFSRLPGCLLLYFITRGGGGGREATGTRGPPGYTPATPITDTFHTITRCS